MALEDTLNLIEAKRTGLLALVKANPYRAAACGALTFLLLVVLVLVGLLATPAVRNEYVVDWDDPTMLFADIKEDPKNFSLLLVVGGVKPGALNPPINETELIDVSTKFKGCSETVPFPYPVKSASGSRYKGHPVICGGFENTLNIHGECWILGNGNWSLLAKMDTPRYAHRTVNIKDDVFWVTGGISDENDGLSTTEIFNGKTGQFERGPVLPSKMFDHCIVKINGTHFALLGGRMLNGTAYSAVGWHESKAFSMYDSVAQTWKTMPDMFTGRRGFVCGTTSHIIDGTELVVAGGFNDTQKTSEIFSFKNNLWRPGPSLPEPVKDAETVQYKDSFLVVNGWYFQSNLLTNSILMYDPLNEAWQHRTEHTHTERRSLVAMMVSEKTLPCPGHGNVFAQDKSGIR